MPKTRRLLTNYSKGELSPLLEGRPDLAAYFEGGKTIENFYLLRQGGLRRRPGTRFISEVKTSAKDTMLLPFEADVNNAYVVEAGDQYFRFYKNKAQIKTSAGGPAVELSTPYTEALLRLIHFTQSVDVLFLFHASFQQRRLSRASDTNWALSAITYSPPPSFEADTDLVATLGIGANTGSSIKMRAGSGVFLAGDVGRQIIAGAGRAVIKSLDSASMVTVDILDAFAATITAGPNPLNTASAGATAVASTAHGLVGGNYVVLTSGAQSGQVRRVASITDANNFVIDEAFPGQQTNTTWNKVLAIASGTWFLRLSPQTTLDPTIKEPVKATVTLVAGANAFRAADVGKFIHIYGGVVKIISFSSATTVTGQIQSILAQATSADPAAAPAGSWTLEEASWSATRGFPRTGEFFQGRLGQASTTAQPTTFWLSAPDDYENYAVGAFADNAAEYTIASRALNRIEWLADNIDLFIGTSGSEHQATGGKAGEPIGGDVIPTVSRLTRHGSSPIQPMLINRRIVFVDRSGQKVLSLSFDWEEDGFDAIELTGVAEHITGGGIDLGPLAFAIRPDPRVYFVRGDGILVTLTLHYREKVIGFTRLVTDGLFEAVAVIPQPSGGPDQVYVIVKRTINGQTKRYIEMFEEEHESLASRAWTELHTDCAKVYSGSATTTITGLSHLEGKTVDVVAGGSVRASKVVTGGQIVLDEAATQVEVGLHYNAKAETMRPAIPNVMIEGLPRSWDKNWVRLKDTIGGTVNGETIQYVPSDLDKLGLFTGDRDVTGYGWNQNDGRITVEQNQPYPMTLLCTFGDLSIGERG